MSATHRAPSDTPFFVALTVLGGSYLLLVALMVAANLAYTGRLEILAVLSAPEIQDSLKLTLVSCFVSAVLSLLVAVPLGYLFTRTRFRGKALLEALVDVPVVLPPLVVGLCLLILFNHFRVGGVSLDEALRRLGLPVTFAVPGVILAQFAVAAAFAVRTMRVAFEQIPVRAESVALTLGCSRGQAFWRVALPQARRGMLAAFTVAWARSLGEFGPLLIFAGTTRGRTEVLSSTVFLEMSVGQIERAAAVSLVMILIAVGVLLPLRRIVGERAL